MFKNIRLIFVLMLASFLGGCSSLVLHLPTDSISQASDSKLIKNDISTKKQKYYFNKISYKTEPRKTVLLKYGKLSRSISEMFNSGDITLKLHNRAQSEIKYLVQRSIYMMEEEIEEPKDDAVKRYLLLGYESILKMIEGE